MSPRFVDFHAIAMRWAERSDGHPVDVAPKMEVLDLVEVTMLKGRQSRRVLLPDLERLSVEQLDFFHSFLYTSPAAFVSKRKLFWKTYGYPAAHGLQTRSEALRQPLKGKKSPPSCSPVSSRASENLDLISEGIAAPSAASQSLPTTQFPLQIEVPVCHLRNLGLAVNWKRNLVSSVTQGYAQQQGVEAGMVLDLVDGHPATKDTYRNALAAARTEGRALSLSFRFNVSDNAVRRAASQLQFAAADRHKLLQPCTELASPMDPNAPEFWPGRCWRLDADALAELYGDKTREFVMRLQEELLLLDGYMCPYPY